MSFPGIWPFLARAALASPIMSLLPLLMTCPGPQNETPPIKKRWRETIDSALPLFYPLAKPLSKNWSCSLACLLAGTICRPHAWSASWKSQSAPKSQQVLVVWQLKTKRTWQTSTQFACWKTKTKQLFTTNNNNKRHRHEVRSPLPSFTLRFHPSCHSFFWPFHSFGGPWFHHTESFFGRFQASAAGFLGRQQTVFVLS